MTAAEIPAAAAPAWFPGESDAQAPTNGAAGTPRPAGLAWRSWDARLAEPGPWHVRHDHPDGSKTVTWPPGLDGHALTDLVYIAGDELPPAGASVIVTEGEKAADAAAETGAYAFGTVCGASSTPGPAVVALLARYLVTLAPDADEPGRDHMGQLASVLERAGLPTLRLVDPPANVPKGWDLADVDLEERRALIAGAHKVGLRTPGEIPDDAAGPSWMPVDTSVDDEQPPDDVDLLGQRPPDVADSSRWPEPENRGIAVLSDLGDTEYVEDLVRPGRIVVVAAEEGTGKSYAIDGELGLRVAVAGGSFAGTWPILRTGPVLVLSEMHPDDDWHRETEILEALELERGAIDGRYWRLPLMTAAGGAPALTVAPWRAWITTWLREHEAILLIVDTATGATAVDPWGKAIQDVYRDLRAMLAAYPALAIVLVLHLKKPQGRGDRRISDVLGEWGRWNDITIMLEADGLTRTKISTHKRIRHPRRIVATKAAGLLIDPYDLDETKSTKVPEAAVVAAIVAEPGIAQKALAKQLEVSPSTAAKYAETAEKSGLIYRVDLGRGKGFRLYPAEMPLDPPPSNGPTPSNERIGPPLDGGLEGSGEGVSNTVHPPVGVDTHSTGPPTVAPSVVPLRPGLSVADEMAAIFHPLDEDEPEDADAAIAATFGNHELGDDA